jgi:hypothetical protein
MVLKNGEKSWAVALPVVYLAQEIRLVTLHGSQVLGYPGATNDIRLSCQEFLSIPLASGDSQHVWLSSVSRKRYN